MKDNIYQFITLDELAKFNNLSKSQLNKIFNQKTNHSPINFFIQLKIQRACKYLDLTKLTIREISEKMGYNDQYYFSKIFKKIMGIPPSQYRKIKKG
jgi:transcriptional regulator GlxA family with amidase domain